jgi:hypothetical protein
LNDAVISSDAGWGEDPFILCAVPFSDEEDGIGFILANLEDGEENCDSM